jgi:hypothetical protein
MLVRVSSIDKDAQHAFAVQEQFLTALASGVPAGSKDRVFGLAPVNAPHS